MIKRFLVCGKQHYFAHKAPEEQLELGEGIEVEMSLETFWEAEQILARLAAMQAAGDNVTDIAAVIKKLYRLLAPATVREEQRLSLQSKLGET